MNTVVLLPARNEEQAIGSVIDEIKGTNVPCAIVVADSASTDRTAQVAREKGARVIDCQKGKGNAVVQALRQIEADHVIMMDSDLTYPASSIPLIMFELLDGADVVMCPRVRIEDGAMPLINRLGNKALTLVANTLYWEGIKDLLSGMWGFRGDALRKMRIKSQGFTLETELFIETVRLGLNIAEVPIAYRARVGEAKLKPMADGLKILWMLIKRRFKL